LLRVRSRRSGASRHQQRIANEPSQVNTSSDAAAHAQTEDALVMTIKPRSRNEPCSSARVLPDPARHADVDAVTMETLPGAIPAPANGCRFERPNRSAQRRIAGGEIALRALQEQRRDFGQCVRNDLCRAAYVLEMVEQRNCTAA